MSGSPGEPKTKSGSSKHVKHHAACGNNLLDNQHCARPARTRWLAVEEIKLHKTQMQSWISPHDQTDCQSLWTDAVSHLRSRNEIESNCQCSFEAHCRAQRTDQSLAGAHAERCDAHLFEALMAEDAGIEEAAEQGFDCCLISRFLPA